MDYLFELTEDIGFIDKAESSCWCTGCVACSGCWGCTGQCKGGHGAFIVPIKY